MEDTLLNLPEFVTSFAEAQISQELGERYYRVLSSYFGTELAKLYERNDNALLVTNNQNLFANLVRNRLEKLETNFVAFIQRILDSQQEQSMNAKIK